VTVERFAELRELIVANDRTIVAAVNERLRLVAELWRLKEELGLERLDPERERALRAALAEANTGPLSERGLQTVVEHLLALTRRELGGGPR
jgi:chorismate mutase